MTELEKLLELQDRDRRLRELDARDAELDAEEAALEAALGERRAALEAAGRALADAVRRRDAVGGKVEQFRAMQQRRQHQLETADSPRVAATLVAELDLARSVLRQEEDSHRRTVEEVQNREYAVAEAEAALEELRGTQTEARDALAARRAEVAERRAALKAERAEVAGTVNPDLRLRYTRLARARGRDVVVPVVGGACSACHTLVPTSRRSALRPGMLDGCELCGVILYLAAE